MSMPLHVQTQVVASGELAVAALALEGSVARVLAVVSRQFVGAGEAPAAAFPPALVRLLTWQWKVMGKCNTG